MKGILKLGRHSTGRLIFLLLGHILSILVSTNSLWGQTREWINYKDCRIREDKYSDGDSFNGVLGLKEGASRPSSLNWRLYGVDCPETDTRSPSRIQEQAKYFRISEPEVLHWGKKAAEFSHKFLSQPFLVYTRREPAGGDSKRPRHFAIIVGANGRLLHEALVEEGLARSYGKPAEWPPGSSAKKFMDRLDSLERSARAACRGIWAASRR